MKKLLKILLATLLVLVSVEIATQEYATVLEGWANTRYLDRKGTYIAPTAFNESAENIKEFPLPLLINHNSLKAPVGRIFQLKVCEEGLYLKAEIFDGQEELLKKYNYLSVGGMVNIMLDNVILSFDLCEVSVVAVPANKFSFIADISYKLKRHGIILRHLLED